MNDHLDQLSAWMASTEDEHLEFKEAKNRFDFEELVKYCCALANEGGGHVILGVTDKQPRRVVGSLRVFGSVRGFPDPRGLFRIRSRVSRSLRGFSGSIARVSRGFRGCLAGFPDAGVSALEVRFAGCRAAFPDPQPCFPES